MDSRMKNSLGGLIFSKDRAMQLRATIESFLLHCIDSDNVALTVLYKATAPLHQHQYDDLKNRFANINFVEERSFRAQSLATIAAFEYVLFLVDDNIFTRDFRVSDVTATLQHQTDALGFSLRLGENTTYCYMNRTWQEKPRFEKIADSILKYDWTAAEHDYGYPLEVSSSVYRSNEVVDFLSRCDFSNPNTLEAQMVSPQWFKNIRPKLLCYHTSVTFCNSINKVQHVYEQNRSGEDANYTSQKLAELYQQGFAIDINKYNGFISSGVHQEVPLYFKKSNDGPIKISVIIPCYNQARFLPEAVGSIINQTYQDWECIIVNDGSSDNTAEVARQLIAKYPNRHIRFVDKPHSGVSDTRNTGIEAAENDWILPLDSDDMFAPTFMQKAVDIIRQEKADIVFANMQEFGASNRQWIPSEYSKERILVENTIPYAAVYTRELWRKVGGYDKLLSVIRQPEDWSFWISCSVHNPVVRRIPGKLFLYRVHPQSTYQRMIKPNRKLSWALLATCHPDLYPIATLVQAWRVIANYPADVYEKILAPVEKNPQYGLVFFWRALRLERQGRLDEAIKHYQAAADKAADDHWQSLARLAALYENKTDVAAARDNLEKLLNVRPNFDWARDRWVRLSQNATVTSEKPKILFYFDRIGNSNSSYAGTMIAVLNFARSLLRNKPEVTVHITGNLVRFPEQYESLRIIPLPPPDRKEQFLSDYDVVFFATHIRYFKDLTKPSGQIWVLYQHCWEADDPVTLAHINEFDAVICLSELHRGLLRRQGFSPEKLLVVPNLIDTDLYSPQDVCRKNHSIMYSGGLHPYKCLDILLDAFQLVRRQVAEAELHIYGDGSMWRGGDYYGNRLESTKPQGVYFHGYVNNKDMPQVYSKHSILCLPSRLETFPMVTVEAQACGCIPVVHNVGGVAATLADGKTGLLYSPNTTEKLAETIIKVFKAVDTNPSIRRRAVDFAHDNFSMTRAAEYISKLWHRLTVARDINAARQLFESNNIEKARVECEQLLQKYPDQPDLLLLQAQITLHQNDKKRCQSLLLNLVEKFGPHQMALNNLGVLSMNDGNSSEALQYLVKAYHLNPYDKNTALNCSMAWKVCGKYQEARMVLFMYLTEVEPDTQALQLLEEINNLITGAASQINVISQQRKGTGDRKAGDGLTVVPYYKPGPSDPLVSVIMTVYNCAEYIGGAIESVLFQNYPKFELIIIDDGSTDNTKEVVSRFDDERIRYIYQENRGMSNALNHAVRQAKGQYVMPLDADDMMVPDFIISHLKEFEKYPEADLVYSDVLLIDAAGSPIRVMNKPEYQDRRHLIRDLFRAGHPIVPFRLGIRRSVYDKIGPYDETLLIAMDYDMIRRFVKAGLKEHHLGRPLHLRRMQPESLSRTMNIDKAKSHFDVIKRFTSTFSYDELFPDVTWDKIPAHLRQLHAKCLVAVTYLAIGQAYVESNSPLYAKTAFEQACSELNDCYKMDPNNQQVRRLLRKSELIRARYAETVQQPVS